MTLTKRWIIAVPDPTAAALAASLGVPLPIAQVLANRGHRDAESARRFLNPRLQQLTDPFELPDMAPAVDRLLSAIGRKQRIVIYGDYDVDGVTSSALLFKVLSAAGATVVNFLPHRIEEGYGLSPQGIARCLSEHTSQLLVAVDCGTSSAREIDGLTRQGVDVIVLDHHEPAAELPRCVALVNPKTQTLRHSDTQAPWFPLASVGVSFKLAHALQKRGRERKLPWAESLDLRHHLDLVAAGTVADNRVLVRAGLERLPRTQKVGLRALMEIAGVRDRVNPHQIGFRIGPRLNAAGRLGDAMAALELLLTENAERARELAGQLNEHNAKRQQVEERITEEALAMARDCAGDRVVVLAREGWHVGVIGIVASRIQQEFYRPTVIIGVEGEMGKGSCRSIAGFSIIEALAHCAPLLERFGGHEMAAGLTVKAEKVGELRRALNEYAAGRLKEEDCLPPLRVDAETRLDELDERLLEQLERLEPCGAGNPSAVFAVRGVRLRGTPRVVGKDHWKFDVTDGSKTVEGIWFGAAERELPRAGFDVAFVPELNEYAGARTIQLRVRDVRPCNS